MNGERSQGAPDPAVASIRNAVRTLLADPSCQPNLRSGEVCVAVSGGADSLALTEAAAHVGHGIGVRVRALIIDHRLQDGSDAVASTAAATARALGADTAEVHTATVNGTGGPEAAARTARYAALRACLAGEDTLVLLGHTRDDQAETVLLGLGRGSGARSMAGMRPLDPPWARPLLDVPRSATWQACAALAVTPWQDPHNQDARFTRVRLRDEVLPLLDDVLAGGVPAALARTARQLREDDEALDTLAGELLRRARLCDDLDVATLAGEPAALRRRTLRSWLLDGGVREVTDAHLRAVDALIAEWRGQGGVWLPGNLEARRARGRLALLPPERTKGD